MNRKKESTIIGLFLFSFIGIFFTIIYMINIISNNIIISLEFITAILISGIYFGAILGIYHYLNYNFKKKSLKSAILIGFMVFSFVGLYENMIYILYTLLVGIDISIVVITGFILCGVFFGLLAGMKVHFTPQFKEENTFFSIKNTIIGSFIIFTFFSLYCNTIYILYTNIIGFYIQIDIIMGLLITGVYFGLISGIIFHFSPQFKDEGNWYTMKNTILVILITFTYFGFYYNLLYGINIYIVGDLFKIEKITGFFISGAYFGIILGIIFKFGPRFKDDTFNVSFSGSMLISSIIFVSISFYGSLMLILYNISIGQMTSNNDVMIYIIIGGLLGYISFLFCNMVKEDD